jgi:SAM-dependent methyltransferase
MAVNGACALEPVPNLNRETREMMEGRLRDPNAVIRKIILPRVFEGLEKNEVYGEKNVTYGPFIRHIYQELECRFVFIKRDGRDVVRSLMDWHNRKFGTIYRECKDPGDLTPSAVSAAANLAVHLDTSDYSRPRPLPSDPLYDKWEELSRFEMCAYYWQKINNLYLDQLGELPGEAWITIDYTSPRPYDVQRVIDFLGLEGISERAIENALSRQINSLGERGVTDGNEFARWTEWNDEQRQQFYAIAGETMTRLGYTTTPPFSSAVKKADQLGNVANFGKFWKTHGGGHDWYTWMYNYRILQHLAFQKWVHMIERVETVESVADFGCGTAVGYVDFFKAIRYVGIDLAPSAVDWCIKNYSNPKHDFRVLDVIEAPPKEEFDLVFSQGTIDNVYDMDAFLRGAVEASRKWIYVTAYRGFFPELEEHRYEYNAEQGVYYNDVSPVEAYSTLRTSGCRDICIYASPTGYEDIPFETVIVAHV